LYIRSEFSPGRIHDLDEEIDSVSGSFLKNAVPYIVQCPFDAAAENPYFRIVVHSGLVCEFSDIHLGGTTDTGKIEIFVHIERFICDIA